MAQEGTGGDFGWPPVRAEARPGAYWWWPGNAVTRHDLTWNLETYRRAGWGNLGVIGIYGVRGEEERFIDIFSPRWFEMFNHTVAEARRLGMNIDLTPSAGWRMGGPHVRPEFGEQSFAIEDDKLEVRRIAAKVKRAGPGGKGLAINPYSQAAVTFHLKWMDDHFARGRGRAPRAFYYDSFENPGNWCPELPETFQRLRGYSLEDHTAALAGAGDANESRRVMCDYRQTLSELLIARVEQYVRWSKQHGSGLRMQAHGAPANLLDMYAAADFPETEVFGATQFAIPGFRRDPKWIRPDRQSDLVNRFASSAAHVAGRNLIISESFTWLRNHFHTALSQIKAESDNLLLNGINGIYYHGCCYAPERTAWPGWLFYASTEANARNSIFRDVPVLNAYITRCQSVLQAGRPDNDILLYWPIYDLWMGDGNRELRFSVHHPEWIDGTPCGEAARWLIERGYTFDFISDRQIEQTQWIDRSLRTAGGGRYRAILVPAARFLTVDTARKLVQLAQAGATVLVWRDLPVDVPGWMTHGERRARLQQMIGRLRATADGHHRPGDDSAPGSGTVIVHDRLQHLLDAAKINREPLVDAGLKFIRRRHPSHSVYFIANHTAKAIDGWTPMAKPCRGAVLMDPMTARTGRAPVRIRRGRAEVFLQLQPGETRILRLVDQQHIDGPLWPVWSSFTKTIPVDGTWDIRFVEGGPVLPQPITANRLASWTELGDHEAARFAGAARYRITVSLPDPTGDAWFLDLGDVRESARVWVNGKPAGVLVAHPFRIQIAELLHAGDNSLQIEVTNLSANRIRDLDRRGVDWKKFLDINLVDQNYKPFDASGWELTPSGLLGPVTLSRAPPRVVLD